MGETLGIAHNVFEKAERERDRKQRLKALEDWQKEKSVRMKRASLHGGRHRPGTTSSLAAATAAAMAANKMAGAPRPSEESKTSLGSGSRKKMSTASSKSEIQRVQKINEDKEKDDGESVDSNKETSCVCVIL